MLVEIGSLRLYFLSCQRPSEGVPPAPPHIKALPPDIQSTAINAYHPQAPPSFAPSYCRKTILIQYWYRWVSSMSCHQNPVCLWCHWVGSRKKLFFTKKILSMIQSPPKMVSTEFLWKEHVRIFGEIPIPKIHPHSRPSFWPSMASKSQNSSPQRLWQLFPPANMSSLLIEHFQIFFLSRRNGFNGQFSLVKNAVCYPDSDRLSMSYY